MKTFYAVLAVIVLVIVGVVFVGYRQVIAENPNFWAEVAADREDAARRDRIAQAETDADVAKAKPYVFGAIGLFFSFIVIGEIYDTAGKPLAVFATLFAVIVGVLYVFGVMDKNGDKQQDTATIAMIQPQGDNLERDDGYSEVNQKNAHAGTVNLVGLGAFAVMLAIVIFLLGFIAQFFPDRHPLE